MASTEAPTDSTEDSSTQLMVSEARQDSDSGQFAPCQIYTIVLIVILILVGNLGLIGNSISSAIIWQFKKKTATTFLLLCLALLDSFLVVTMELVTAVPIAAYYTENTQYFIKLDAYIHAYVRPLAHTVQMATTWLMVIVATQRYVAVCLPHHYSKYGTVKAARWQVAGVISFTLSFNLVRFFELRIIQTRFGRVVSVPTDLGENYLYNKLYTTGLDYIFIFYVCPLLILTEITYSLKKALGKSMKMRRPVQEGVR